MRLCSLLLLRPLHLFRREIENLEYQLGRVARGACEPVSYVEQARVYRLRSLLLPVIHKHAAKRRWASFHDGRSNNDVDERGKIMSMTKRVSAELLGTFWLVLGGCGSTVLAAAFPDVGIGLVGVSIAFDLTVLTMAYTLGYISGCHLNPAVSVGLLASGRFSAAELFPYVVAQAFSTLLRAEQGCGRRWKRVRGADAICCHRRARGRRPQRQCRRPSTRHRVLSLRFSVTAVDYPTDLLAQDRCLSRPGRRCHAATLSTRRRRPCLCPGVFA